ncbi:hypothetical protein BO71DRAFT_334380 [Aspergillus ellipticus CBS 707.79]|uniref:Uncharacterized protein n=1 Tax=Aspergillus ellipticus CBS 707.79 TaxID=1448320 RepID=A0A319CZV9_9EURO|nr:hypothetical protein BO71DRAFT_334380 [Aspergillus ellipticus CBS 707.79]
MRGSPNSGAKPEKTMSSRLLTMKFMQRAAATNATKEPSQPASTDESKLATPKRQRLSTGPGESPIATPQSDLDAISAALAEEEEKRREALARQAQDSGDTEWVLDYGAASPTPYAPPPFIVADESLDADDDDMGAGGRQAYGNFRRKKKTATGEDADKEDGEKKEVKSQPRVRVSQLTSISGSGHAKVGGDDKKQKKRKHK